MNVRISEYVGLIGGAPSRLGKRFEVGIVADPRRIHDAPHTLDLLGLGEPGGDVGNGRIVIASENLLVAALTLKSGRAINGRTAGVAS